VSSRAAQTARDLPIAVEITLARKETLVAWDLRASRKRFRVAHPATVRSLGALRQLRG
jgi:hypothetical protein